MGLDFEVLCSFGLMYVKGHKITNARLGTNVHIYLKWEKSNKFKIKEAKKNPKTSQDPEKYSF